MIRKFLNYSKNPKSQAQISHRLDGIPPSINKIKWRDNKAPNPKLKNYDLIFFRILLEIENWGLELILIYGSTKNNQTTLPSL